MASVARPAPPPGEELSEATDHRVLLHGVSWPSLRAVLAARGDQAGVRIAYLDGELELMSPSPGHELVKKCLARLVEAYAEERGIELNGVGSWTLRRRPKQVAVEPDECYVLGDPRERDRPDLAIEIAWSKSAIDRLEVHRRLGVHEVWLWRRGAIEVHVLRDGRDTQAGRSELFPDLDLALLARLAELPSQPQAVRELRAALRRGTARRRRRS